MAMPLRLRLRTALRALTGRSTAPTSSDKRRRGIIEEEKLLGLDLTPAQRDHLETLPPSLRINLLSAMAHQQQVTQIATHTETIAHTLDAALRTPDSTLVRALRNT